MPADVPAGRAAPPEPTRRLFYALWPDEAMRSAMVEATREAARASGGRAVPEGNLHVTLAFLGLVPGWRLQALAEVAREATGGLQSELAPAGSPGKPVELIFDQLEHWRAAQVLCASAASPPPQVGRLARKLRELLVDRGFAPDLKPFRPHVTVVRKVVRPRRMAKMQSVSWRFTDFALIESRTLREGALYSVVESFPLCSGTKMPAAISDGAPRRSQGACGPGWTE